MKRTNAMLVIEAMQANTIKAAEASIARLATIRPDTAVCIEAIKALVSIAARPVNISNCTFKGK